MKKSVKRILCAALACSLSFSLATEQVVRLFGGGALGTNTEFSTAFENVTGQFDTTALRQQNFNTQVQSAQSTPKYETRTVIVTLSGENAVAAADGKSVSSYVRSFSGQKTLADIESSQNAFLRKLTKQGISYKLERRYDTLLNAVAITVNTKYVSQIKKMAGVQSAVITTTYAQPDTIKSGAREVTNQTSVYDTGIYDATKYTTGENDYGKGTVVAVLDTGLDYTHQAFRTMPVAPAWDESYVAQIMADNVLAAETKSGSLSASDVYVSAKVPFAYDYADDDADVYPSYSNHGTHVAGIIGGYDESGYTDKNGVNVWEDSNGNGVWDADEKAVTFRGVVPNAQLVICKVFTDDLDDEELGGATPEDIIAALEDCVMLGVDVINMSLGTSCGFTTTNDGDDEGELLNAVYESIAQAGISLVCAASNDYSAGYGGAFGTNLTTNPDSGTVGSPSTFASALSVASISGQKSPYMFRDSDGNGVVDENETTAFYEESRDENGKEYDFAKQMLGDEKTSDTFEYVVIPGTGSAADYTTQTRRLLAATDANGKKRIALIERGDNTFQDKVEVAMEMGAGAVIIYNNVAGMIRMNLGEIDNPCPAVSIDMDAGYALADTNGDNKRDYNGLGKIVISKDTSAGPFMSEFSSWGPTHDLKLKPEITAHGGEITSTVPGGYGEQSGTSMASPNMAGVMALIRSYIKSNAALAALTGDDPVKINRLANQLIMSTATTVCDQAGRAYSPRKQGAGLGSLENVIEKTAAYLFTDNAESDYRPKLELGDDKERTGVYENISFSLKNFGARELSFETSQLVLTETVAKDGLAVAEQAYALSPKTVDWVVTTGDGVAFDKATGVLTVQAGKTAAVSVKIELSDQDKAYLEQTNKHGDKVFKNGMYVEGFLQLASKIDGQCDLSIPFLAFYGDWKSAPMLDYTAFETSASEQDAAVLEENKLKEQVWATQPYAMYYNEKYILPMGGYVYLLDENDEKMYTKEEYCAVSRYNEYYPDDETSNYLTSTGIKAVYAGLLRNARVVKYKLYDVQTGELIVEDAINRVGKAYSGGGTPTPANVELELRPEEYGLAANGQYRMDFEFFTDAPAPNEKAAKENTFSFSFTVDYEAPVLENARVRYYDYKDGTKEKQKIYLDVDVYDNHYAQAIMLCYPKKIINSQTGEEETVLQLATEYPTPVRNAVKNGKTTVSIEITDIYEEYGKQLYLQIDDYAINSCLYKVDIEKANALQTPDSGFALASGENKLTLGIYETHKVALKNIGSANRSNLVWISQNPAVADVKNGEIVGLKAGETIVMVSDPDKDPNKVHSIQVTVTEEQTGTLVSVPTVSFGVIKTSSEALQKATGVVSVSAGQTIPLKIQTDPWYHPMTGLSFKWSSTDESVATVDQNGVVKTCKKGTAIIGATVLRDGLETRYFANVTLRVQEEFDVSNYTLNRYNGVGYNQGSVQDGTDILVVPTDMNIMYIGEDAFKDNENVRRIVIPASVVEIRESAFENCKSLEEVYFVSEKHRQNDDQADDVSIDFADLFLVHRRAFFNCKVLKKVDFANVKTITLDQEVFLNCEKLETVVDMPSIGTAYHRAFKNCTALQAVDLSGLHVSGENVFENCVSLHTVQTDTFTAIGENMFAGCVGLREKITLRSAKVASGAFSGCLNLKGVTFDVSNVDIGARAFENCGVGVKSGFAVDFNGHTVRTIGNQAFKGAKLAVVNQTFTLPDGLVSIGADIFNGCQTVKTVALGNVDLDGAKLLGAAFKGLNVTVAQDSTKFAEEQGVIYALESGEKTKLVYVNTDVSGSNGILDLSAMPIAQIGEYAFANVKGITQLVLPESVVSIGEGAFADSSMTKIEFNGAAITGIPAWAFAGAKIQTIALPVSVTKIGEYAFMGSMLQSIVTKDQSAILGVLSVGDYAFAASALSEIAFVDGDDNVVFGNGVFAGAKSLKKAILPSVETIGYSTFQGATSLKTASFGLRSLSMGDYTFADTAIEKVVYSDEEPKDKAVTLRQGQTVIGERAFYNVAALTEIVLATSVTEIGDYAFYGAKWLAKANLENVQVFGDYAFYATALTALALNSAKSIGDYAFSASAQTKYLSLSIPVVEKIGAFAFCHGAETTVVLPQSVKEIGVGAFAASRKLETITFADVDGEPITENGVFFVENGVLYRYIDEAKTQFALLCYPGALSGVVPDIEGATKKQYKIKDGTVRVEAYSFYDLEAGTLDWVVLPYSVKVIGNAAFLKSGVLEYTFESIQAPVLETAYRADIQGKIEALATDSTVAFYKGYYYSNFQADFYNYTPYVGKTSGLALHYPTNGKGYDTYIYRLYFGTRKKTGVMMTDTTRACLGLVSALVDADEVASWLDWNPNDVEKKERVQAFSEQVKAARASYNNVLKDEAQAAIFGEENGAKLLAVEEQLRAVKTHFRIPVYVSGVAPAKTSEHKATYTEGEKFDWTGLVLTVTYDDGSTTQLTPESGLLTLQNEGVALTPYDSYVIVEYTENGKTKAAYVVITVNERELSSIEKYPEEANTMKNVLVYGGGAMVIVGTIGVLVMFAIKKRRLAKAAVMAQIQPFDMAHDANNAEVAITDEQKPQD